MTGTTVTLGRSSAGPSTLGIPRVYLPDDLAVDHGRYVCLRRASGAPAVGMLTVPAMRARGASASASRASDRRAACDASGRYALAIPEASSDRDVSVEVLPLGRSWRSRVSELLARPFGLRYVALRVSKALPVDVERPVVRCQPKVFDLLGCEPGDRVVLASATVPVDPPAGQVDDADRTGDAAPHARWTTTVSQAFEISQPDLDRRLEAEVAHPDEEHPWLSPERGLGMRIDLPRVFMAHELRRSLDVPEGGVVLVRRQIRSIFGRHFREFGLLVLLAGLALSQLPLPVQEGWGAASAFLGIAFLLGLLITGVSIRSKVQVGGRSRGRR